MQGVTARRKINGRDKLKWCVSLPATPSGPRRRGCQGEEEEGGEGNKRKKGEGGKEEEGRGWQGEGWRVEGARGGERMKYTFSINSILLCSTWPCESRPFGIHSDQSSH